METLSTFAPLRLRHPGTLLRAAVSWLVRADSSHRQRVAFDRLDPHLRRDIGLETPAASTWDAPIVMRLR